MKPFNYKAVLFDMDGTLTDSEPLWKIAMEEVFQSIGCPLKKKDFQKTVGLRIDEVIEYWFNTVGWENATPKEVEQRIIDKMDLLIRKNAQPLPGVIDTLHYLKANNLKIGLATSSYSILIKAVLETLEIESFFDFVHSAENEVYGKPHPAVFLTVADVLEVKANECVVIEDSLNGVIAGKAAKMKVVCIPEKSHIPDPKLIIADYTFDTMSDFLISIQ